MRRDGLDDTEKSLLCRAVDTLLSSSCLYRKGGDNLSPPFSKGWITFLHLFYIVRRILTIGKNLYYIHNAEVPLFSLGVPHCAYPLVFKYLYLLFLCHKYLMFCSKNLQTCLQNLYVYFIISSSNPSVSRSMLRMSSMIASSVRSCTGL